MVLAQQAKCACMTAQRGYSTGKAFQPADAYPQPLINHPKNAVKTQKSGFPEVSRFAALLPTYRVEHDHRRLFLMIKCNYALARQNFSGNLGCLGRVSQKPRKNDTAY